MKQNKKRLCLFAGFDAQGEIADYVIYYLKALSKFADIYYWGDFEASNEELVKLKPFCKAAYCEKHYKYDFGSWQELIYKIGREKIEQYDEAILANDSCYGPLFDLSGLFKEMDGRDCDFWGLSSAYNRHIHLQSYFIVLKRPILQSDIFHDFFKLVEPEANYDDVCLNYEDRFTYILSKAGFRSSSFIAYNDLAHHPYKDAMTAIKKRHFPFLKVKFFLGGISDQGGVSDWRKIITENTDYPVSLIEEDLTRRGLDLSKIDRAIREKHIETPSFDYEKTSLKRCIRKFLKITLKPILQKHDHPKITIEERYSRENKQPCRLALENRDATVVKHFSLDLPLTNESNVLIIGDLDLHKIFSLGIYDLQTIFLNSRRKKSFQTNDICGFSFKNKLGQLIYFDFILVQPFEAGATAEEIRQFLANLKYQMISESVLVLIVPAAEKEKYEQSLRANGLYPANSERGIVARYDPFQVYYDKIYSIKDYKALIYKIK